MVRVQEDAYGSYASVAAREVGAEVGIVAWSGRGLVQNSDGTREGTLPKLLVMVLPRSPPFPSPHATGVSGLGSLPDLFQMLPCRPLTLYIA